MLLYPATDLKMTLISDQFVVLYSPSPLTLAANEDSSGEEGSGSPGQHSSSDPGSDLDELLTKDFPTEDLPSLISRAIGKGE